MSTSEILLLSAAVTLAYVTAVWLLSLALRNASIIDIGWGLAAIRGLRTSTGGCSACPCAAPLRPPSKAPRS